MPGQILRGCAKCGAPFQPRHAQHRHCPIHEHDSGRRSPTTRTRPSSSTARDKLRKTVLARDPECQLRLPGCTGTSQVMDHIVPAAHGGTYDLDNLQGACAACNGSKGGKLASGTWTPPPRPAPHGARLT